MHSETTLTTLSQGSAVLEQKTAWPTAAGLDASLFPSGDHSAGSFPKNRNPATGDATPAPKRDQALETLRAKINTALGEEAAQIHFSWFVAAISNAPCGQRGSPLPENVLAHLPKKHRDRIALSVGTRNRTAGRLAAHEALELAKMLWAGLEPVPSRAQVQTTLTHLVDPSWAHFMELDEPEWIALLDRLGVRVFGALLAALPERAAAACCKKLPPAQARTLWLERRRASNDPKRRKPSRALMRTVSAMDPAACLRWLGARLFRLALNENEIVLRWIALRLPVSVGAELLPPQCLLGYRCATRSSETDRLVVDRCVALNWVQGALNRNA